MYKKQLSKFPTKKFQLEIFNFFGICGQFIFFDLYSKFDRNVNTEVSVFFKIFSINMTVVRLVQPISFTLPGLLFGN